MLWSKDTPTSTTTRLLRFDLFGLAIGKLRVSMLAAPLAGKHSESVDGWPFAQEQERYVKVTADSKVLEQVFRPVFCAL